MSEAKEGESSMRNELAQETEKYAKSHHRKNMWYRIVSVLAAMTVFCTTYALILPAITLERANVDEAGLAGAAASRYYCGYGEHSHIESCFDENDELICTIPNHTHSDACLVQTNTDAAVWSSPYQMLLAEEETAVDLKTYVISQGGTFTLALYDAQGHPIPEDGDGYQNVTAGEPYLLNLYAQSAGFHAGTYVYQMPEGVGSAEAQGNLEVGGRLIGTWSMNADGTVTVVLNEDVNSATNLELNINFNVTFQETDNPLVFDGDVKVKVNPPETPDEDSEIHKWERNQSKIENADPDKIYWELEIKGKENSDIVGNLLSDTIYTEKGVNHKWLERPHRIAHLPGCVRKRVTSAVSISM